MKKLKLNLQSLNAEVLTRSQLKQILGGDSGSGSNCDDKRSCQSSKDCYYGYCNLDCTDKNGNKYTVCNGG